MKFAVTQDGSEKISADWLVCFVDTNGGGSQLPAPLASIVAKLKEAKDFEAKANELFALHHETGLQADRVLFVGLGDTPKVTPTTLTRAAGTAIRSISTKKRSKVTFTDPGGNLPARDRAAALVTGVAIGLSGQDIYKKERARHEVEEIVLQCAEADAAGFREGVVRGETIGNGVNLARHLVNQSPAVLYPESFCEQTKEALAGTDVEIEILGPKELAEQKMGGILAVGNGSARPPRLLILRYKGPGATEDRPLCFVGKGITFDSGGLSIKTADGMIDMKCDMAGAATVVATMQATARLKLPIHLLGIAPLAENMPSSNAFRPGDVLTAKNGKTIEIQNTDAEGRLVLADALSHAVDLNASHIVDLATLTGACMVALGMNVAGVMTNDDAWGKDVIAAADRAGERVWPLPMFEEYDELIKSQIADMKNTGGRWGGAISAAKLLVQFVGKTPWAHIDIAGPAYADKESSYQDGGGTGFGVRTLIELAETLASKS